MRRFFRSPNAGQTSLTLQHSTSPRSGYRPNLGANRDGYPTGGIPIRTGFKKGGSVRDTTRNPHKDPQSTKPRRERPKASDLWRKVSEKSTHSKTGLREAGYKPQPHGTHSPGNIKTLRKAWGRTEKKKPHSTKEGRHATASRKFGRVIREAAGMKKGGWIQDVNKSIKKRGTKGKCTPITKKGCTGRAKALAKTFKKMGRARKGK